MKRELSILKHLDLAIQEVQGIVVEVGTMAVTKIKVVAIITKVEVVVVTDVAVNTTMPVDQATLVAEADRHRYECSIRVFLTKVILNNLLRRFLNIHVNAFAGSIITAAHITSVTHCCSGNLLLLDYHLIHYFYCSL